ncbi:hypothetical protein H4R24_004249 [Coemansia sp. RSA 988]|nr:hypothetical protein H4R24_004249 [Coemansia sp. RSA 988]
MIARAPISSDPCRISATNTEKPTTILDIEVLDCDAGVIKPFHSPKSSTQRALRASPPPSAALRDITNRYNRVRRRSPLCHDVLEFMLEGASTSSQESLLIGSVAAENGNANGNQERSATEFGQMKRPATEAAYAPHSNNIPHDTPATAATTTEPIQSLSGHGRSADTACLAQISVCSANISSRACIERLVNSHAEVQGSGLVSKPSGLSVLGSISDDKDTDDGNDSDSSADCVSDNGFDGQCDMSSLTASAKSTAECSRSDSCKSSASTSTSRDGSVASDSSTTTTTSTEPSLSWWRRHFRTARSKSPTQSQSSVPSSPLLRRSTIGGHTDASESVNRPISLLEDDPPISSSCQTTRAPILTRLRRTMSSKSVAKKLLIPDSKKRHMVSPTAAASSQPKLARSSLMPVSRKSPKIPDNTVPATLTRSSHAMAEQEDISDCLSTNDCRSEDEVNRRWIMLMCKGTTDLHVVSVPTDISSMNHKDTFLLYPCVLRNHDKHQTSMGIAHRSAGGRTTVNHSPKHNADMLIPTKDTMLLGHQECNISRFNSVCSLTSREIYVWLGAHSSPIKRDAITRVAMEIRDRELTGSAAVVIIDESAAADSARKKFFLQLYAAQHGSHVSLPTEMSTIYSQITPMSRAGDDMNFERALQRRKVMYGFWETIPPATIISTDTYVNAAALSKVPVGGVVVLDTWSDVFVWSRDEPCSMAVRRCAINFASMLVKDACIPPRPESASVWHELHGSEHVIFKTKFSDWPFVFASSKAVTEVSHQTASDSRSAISPVRSVPYSAQPVAVI